MSQDFEWDETALHDLEYDVHGPVGRDLERRAINGESAAKRLLSQHGSGRIYRKSHPRRIHQASAPGEPPAPDLALLRAAMSHAVGHDEEGIYAEWGVAVGLEGSAEREGGTTIGNIGLYLELGTRHIAPRPFLRPSIPAAAGDSEI